jgi:hypothetical protein
LEADLNEAMQEHLRQKQQLDDDSEPVYSDEDEVEVLAEPKQRVNFKRKRRTREDDDDGDYDKERVADKPKARIKS